MAFSIGNTYFTNYSVDASDPSADKVSGTIQKAQTDEEMMNACRQFEAYLIQQMYKNMEEATKILTEDEDDDGGSSDYIDLFSDNYLEDIANRMVSSGQGLGIAEQLYNSIKANQGEPVADSI